MDELYGLIRSLAERIDEEPVELATATDYRDQEYREQVVQHGSPPSYNAVPLNDPTQRVMQSESPAEPIPQIRFSGDPAQPMGSNPIQIPVAPISSPQPDSGETAQVYDVLKVAGAAATVFQREGYTSAPAETQSRDRVSDHQITPDIHVRTTIPEDFLVENALGLFQFADQLLSSHQDVSPTTGGMPEALQAEWDHLTESSEQIVARMYQEQVAPVEDQNERMILP